MTRVTIHTNITESRKEFAAFYNFRWKTELKNNKMPVIGMSLSLLIFVISLSDYLSTHKVFDLVVSIISFLGLVYIPFGFVIRKIWFMNWIKKHHTEIPDVYEFAFDENGIYYKAPKFNSELKWDYFHSFEMNQKENAIYLYGKSKRLQEIFVKRLLGDENFKEISAIIMKKIPPRT